MRTRTMLLAANKKYNAYVHDLEDCYISFYRHCMEDYIDYTLDRVDVDDIVDKVPISMWLPTSRTKELRDAVPSHRELDYWHRGDTYSRWLKKYFGTITTTVPRIKLMNMKLIIVQCVAENWRKNK